MATWCRARRSPVSPSERAPRRTTSSSSRTMTQRAARSRRSSRSIPVPGALDVLLAPEFLEVGRAIELGFPSPARTTIIASSHRLYAIHEKMAIGRAIYPAEDLSTAARAFSRTADRLRRAGRSPASTGTEANAVLLGALAASGVLPVSEAAYRKAIEAKGVQVAANLKGFDVGLARARAVIVDGRRPSWRRGPSRGASVDPPGGFAGEVAALPGAPPRRRERSAGPSHRLSGRQRMPVATSRTWRPSWTATRNWLDSSRAGSRCG